MKFLDWYLKIGVVSALVGASMELFMIKTGFCLATSRILIAYWELAYQEQNMAPPRILTGWYHADDKVTVLESEKRAWENSPEAQAVREALNPWKHIDAERTKKS